MLLQVGRVCIKKYGRDAGSRAVISSVNKNEIKIISAIRQKERRCNPAHLEFLNEMIDVGNKELVNKTLGVKEKVPHAEQASKAAVKAKR